MSILQSINFESFVPNEKFKSFNKSFKKSFYKSSKKIKNNFKEKKNLFYSFSKDFKLNFSLSELKKYKRFKRIITIGMGGSILGAQAINFFLKKKINKELIFINNLDPDQLNKLKGIKNLNNSLFIFISKSGNTIEVLTIINFLKNKANFNNNNSLVITTNKKSHLSTFAKKLRIKIIFHRHYIGGRYSVFSETALVPCYLMNINIIKLKKKISHFLDKKKHTLIKNLINLSKVYNSRKINSLVLLNYCQGLEYFLLWCQQLIAESLGKKGKGKIPIISIGPRDHHSLLQLYLDGPKDSFFYFFSLNNKKKINKNKGFFVEALNNKDTYEVIENQKKALITLFKNKKIPFLSIEMKKRNEETLGELFSYFIFETVLMGENLKVDPFSQPAVEQLKTLTKDNLFKKNRK